MMSHWTLEQMTQLQSFHKPSKVQLKRIRLRLIWQFLKIPNIMQNMWLAKLLNFFGLDVLILG